jgi:transposase
LPPPFSRPSAGVETRRELAVLLVGIDWAERHHDVCVMAADGSVLARERIADGVAGVARLHELIASWAEEPAEVVVGIETDRGLLVGALVAAGYQVIAVNPLAASRYRERHTISRPSRTAGMRGCWPIWSAPIGIITGRQRVTRGWPRRSRCWPEGISSCPGPRQRQANMLRSALRAFYPAALAAFGSDPGGRDAVAVLRLAPTPESGRARSQAELVDTLRRAGRRRQVEARAAAIQAMLAGQQLEASPVVAAAFGQVVVVAAVAVIASLSQQLAGLEAALTAAFTAHPDAVIVQSQPGLGVVLAARVLAEFGDDPLALCQRQGRQGLCRHCPDHPGLGVAAGGAGPVCGEPATEHRLSSVGLCRLDRLSRGSPLLRRSPGPRRHSPSGPAGAWQPAGRDLARLPAPPSAL